METLLTINERDLLTAPVIDTSIPLCVFDITDVAAVKAKLVKLYGDVAVQADGQDTQLCDVGRARVIRVGALPHFDKQRYNAADSLRVISRLTREGDGCPWDRAQTHESIRVNMIEEAYEAVDAVNRRDAADMCEEFGDVYLQSILQSDIAARAGEFDFSDVCDGLCKKLIGRHTFIFAGDSATNADEALGLWEKNKGIEKHYDSVKTQLKKLPDNFPSALYCQKVYKKCKKGGLKTDPRADLEKAAAARDYTRMIAACVALLSDEGKDAEVELYALVKAAVDGL